MNTTDSRHTIPGYTDKSRYCYIPYRYGPINPRQGRASAIGCLRLGRYGREGMESVSARPSSVRWWGSYAASRRCLSLPSAIGSMMWRCRACGTLSIWRRCWARTLSTQAGWRSVPPLRHPRPRPQQHHSPSRFRGLRGERSTPRWLAGLAAELLVAVGRGYPGGPTSGRAQRCNLTQTAGGAGCRAVCGRS